MIVVSVDMAEWLSSFKSVRNVRTLVAVVKRNNQQSVIQSIPIKY